MLYIRNNRTVEGVVAWLDAIYPPQKIPAKETMQEVSLC